MRDFKDIFIIEHSVPATSSSPGPNFVSAATNTITGIFRRTFRSNLRYALPRLGCSSHSEIK